MSTVPRPVSQAIEAIPHDERLVSLLRDYWYVWLVAVATLVQIGTLWRVLRPVTPSSYPPLRDSLIFEYIGWYLTEGGRLYVDVWEVKPPLAFELPAVLAMLAGGNVRVYHTLVLAVTSAAAVGCAFAVGLLIEALTGDEFASAAGGLVLFAFPAFHWRAAFGFKPKYFVVLAGLLAVYLALRDRPFPAGIAGAASAGFWQFGAVFPLLAFGVILQRRGRRGATRVIAGGLLASSVVLAPVVWWGALEEMVAETVLTPLLVRNDGGSIGYRFRLALRLFGRTVPVALLGLGGLVLGARERLRERWWLLAGTSWFAAQVLLFDLDAYPDLFPVFAFVALGIGLVLGDPSHRQDALHALVAAMVLLSVFTLGSLPVGTPTHPPAATAVDAPYWGDERSALLWRTVETETCRPFFGVTQDKLVDRIGGSLHDTRCGDIDPVWTAFRQRFLSLP